jgi:hypothetical protein
MTKILERKVYEASDGTCFPNLEDAEAYEQALMTLDANWEPFVKQAQEEAGYAGMGFNLEFLKETLMKWERFKFKTVKVEE